MSSSSENVICINDISKYFEIYDKPSHRLWQMLWRGRRCFYKPFWALRNISFSVGRGECIGIIGRNGAGKSTLLQIVTGTLAPSSGSVQVKGRVAALLELGSGFNPEFTGRENVYLNAAILGLTQEEIEARYQDIVAFADIGDFIDQPVKSYSSGMVVRLAFAVIAHVDADVLIIDEALSVGDAFFTQKCMRFLHKFIAEKTTLFVSHDISAVNSLCNKVVLMENGHIKQIGNPKDVTATYLKDMYESNQGESHIAELPSSPPVVPHRIYKDMRADFINASSLRNDIQAFAFNEDSASFGKGGASITDVVLQDQDGQPLSWIVGGEFVTLKIQALAHKDIFSPIIGFHLKNHLGLELFGDNTFLTYREKPLFLRQGESACALFSFTMPVLAAGEYSIGAAIAEGSQQDHVQHDWRHDALILRSTTTSCHTGMMGIPMQDIRIIIH